MIAAGRDLFLERGFDAVSLGEIVRQSGGSLSTLYELFTNKAGLLREVVRSEQFDRCKEIVAIHERQMPPAETLRSVALLVHEQFLHPSKIALMRIVMSETLRNPDFGREIYEHVHVPFLEAIEGIFRDWAKSGEADIPDPCQAARFFIGLVLHSAQSRALFGDTSGTCLRRREEDVSAATELFLKGYGLAKAA